MSVPERIQIGPISYVVTFDDAMSDAANAWGYIKHAKQSITLDSRQEGDHQSVTVLHEVLHAIYFQLGLKRDDEEDVVTRLAPLLLDTLRRNPDLAAYLLETTP